jgi:hypothetical protein
MTPMAHASFDPRLRPVQGGWVAEGDGLQVRASCGQEALLRLNIELARREPKRRQTGRLIIEDAPYPEPA